MKLRIAFCFLALALSALACVDSGYSDPYLVGAVADAQVQATESARRERDQLARLSIQATQAALQAEGTRLAMYAQSTQDAATATVGSGYAMATATHDAALAQIAAATAGAVRAAATQAAEARIGDMYATEAAKRTQAVIRSTQVAMDQEWSKTVHGFRRFLIFLLEVFCLVAAAITAIQYWRLREAKRQVFLLEAQVGADRKRLMDTSSGPAVIKANGDAELLQREWVPPVINNWPRSQAGFAESAERLQSPAPDPDQALAAKLLLDAIQVNGDDGAVIPRWETLRDATEGRAWRSTRQWELATDWLVGQGAVIKERGHETVVTAEFETLGGLLRAIQQGRLPSPTGADADF